MAVTVRLFAAARSAAGVSEIQVEPGTLGDVLGQLTDQFPGLAQVLPQCSYLVNETACNDQAVNVSDSSTLDVLPPFAGG